MRMGERAAKRKCGFRPSRARIFARSQSHPPCKVAPSLCRKAAPSHARPNNTPFFPRLVSFIIKD